MNASKTKNKKMKPTKPTLNTKSDSSSSLDETFSSDGQLHERVKDIKIVSNDSSVQSRHNPKTKEVELRKSIKEKLCSSLDSDRNTRPGGDGESVPETPPNEVDDESSSTESKRCSNAKYEETSTEIHTLEMGKVHNNPFSVQVTVDGLAILLFICGIATRMHRLDLPRHVVFDEMHYGKYAAMYLKNTFFFDANPPLGKMLIALAGYVSGFDGNFGFDKIGTPYPEGIPLFALRFVPALCGSALTPTIYLILCELGLSPFAGGLAGILFLFDTAFLAQSRYILLESIMMLFSFLAVLSVLKMRKYNRNALSSNSSSPLYSTSWWFWLISAAVNMGLAFSVKYLAFYSCTLCVALLARDVWNLRLIDKKASDRVLVIEVAVQAICVAVIPLLIYIGLFHLHLSLLTKAGSHDNLMTSAFQASLEGGLSSIIKGQPLVVAHGSQITLRHTHGRTCWMHSHEHVYPVRYSDGRGSSHQQQVSCYGYKDVNNWWIVKRPDREDLAVHEPLDVIRHGDVVQLVHGMTHRALNSHDVAAPMTPHCQEITAYIDYNISMSAENLWRVEIVNAASDESDENGKKAVWHSINSQIRLVHVASEQALRYSGKVYPDWGFYQNEVVCDKNIVQLDTVWNVEEHRYTKSDEDKKTLEKEIFGAEMIPEAPTYLTFWEKFLELQIKMLITNQENVQNHNYASDPSEWPFLTRGIAYFISKESNAQIHLLGNIAVWYSGTICVVLYCALLVFYLLRRQRHCFDIPEEAWVQYVTVGEVLLGGYLFHFVPFFFCDRTLFLHHYLPAYAYKIMLSAFVITHLYHVMRYYYSNRILQFIFILLTIMWLLAIVYVFKLMSVLSYGSYPLSADDVRSLRWKDTWDLIIHKQ